MRAIGRVLNRSASTSSREIACNSGGTSYIWRYAQQRRVRRRRYARPAPKLVGGNPLFEFITYIRLARGFAYRVAVQSTGIPAKC